MKKFLSVILLMVFVLSVIGCSTNSKSDQSDLKDTSTSSAQEKTTVSSDSDQAYPQVHLDSVKFLGEFPTLMNANELMGSFGERKAIDVTPQSRFVIFRYDFTTLAEAGSMATYGGTISLWKGSDMNSPDAKLDVKLNLFDETGGTFENGVFTQTGPNSRAFAYKTNEKHAQYLVVVVPNSVNLADLNVHFSNKSTISEIGYDFKAN